MATYLPGLAEGIQSGLGIAKTFSQEKRLSEALKGQQQLQEAQIGHLNAQTLKEQFQTDMEQKGMEGLAAIQQDSVKEQQSRAMALQTVSTLNDFIQLPPALRDTDFLQKAFKEQTGLPLAPTIFNALKKGKTEDLQPIVDHTIDTLSQNPQMNMSHLSQILSNPMAANQALMQANKAGQAQTQTEQVTGPQEPQGIPKEKLIEFKTQQLQSKIDKYHQLAISAPGTNASKVALAEIDNLRAEMEKLNPAVNKDSYGGLQVIWDSKQNRYVYGLYSQKQNQMVRVDPPQGTSATVQQNVQAVQTPNGIQLVEIPGRGAPGQPVNVTPTGLTPKQANVPEKELEFFTKAKRDVENINLLLTATDPKATPEQKAYLASQGIKWDPNATGAKALVGSFTLQRLDPSGISVRAGLGDFQADSIHARYAGNLTGQEIKRSQQWAVSETDSSQKVRENLINQRRVLMSLVNEKSEAYTPQGGFNPNPVTAPVTPTPITEANPRGVPNGMTKAQALKKILDANPGSKASDSDVQQLLKSKGF